MMVGLKSRTFLVLIASISAVALFVLSSPNSINAQSLNDLLKKQEQIRKQIEKNKKNLEQKKKEQNTLQGIIYDLGHEINAAESEITNTEQEINVINQIITELNNKISSLQNRLNSAYISLYEISRLPDYEIILDSSKINDAVSQAQFIQSVQTQLQAELQELTGYKTKREEQMLSLKELKSSLEAMKKNLISQRSRQNYLLSLNTAQQQAYENGLKDLQKQQMRVSAEIAKWYKRFADGGTYGGTGGYPLAGINPWVYIRRIKPWSCIGNGTTAENSTDCDRTFGRGLDFPELGYYTRNCTSYAAWKWKVTTGVNFSFAGHAKNWPSVARNRGYTVNRSPAVGALMVWPGLVSNGTDEWGHVAYVEEVYENGTVLVSQYNAGLDGRYSTQVKSSAYDPNLGTPEFIHPR